MPFFILTGLLCLLFFQSPGQENLSSPSVHSEVGFPLIQNYGKEVYHAHEQNWDVVQDSTGLLYFGNNDGVLIYDGVSWELIRLPNQGTPFSLTIDENNRVYVGANGELGYLEADEHGQLGYVSLLSFLSEEDHEYVEVRETFHTPKGIYFRTPDALFQWTGEHFKVWQDKGEKIRSFWINNTLYVQVLGKALMAINENSFESVPVPEGDFFKDKVISCMLPYDKNHILIGTLYHGLFMYDGEQLTPFTTENDAYLKKNKIYRGIVLSDSSFALGTLEGGLIILDRAGKQKVLLNENNGLISSLILALYQDKSGIIWAGLNTGIAKVEYPSPITVFDGKAQLDGIVFKITRYQHQLFAGTDRGLFQSNFDRLTESPKFQQFPGFRSMVWDILSSHGRLLVAADYKIQEIKNGQVQIINEWVASKMVESRLDSNRVFVGLTDGFASLYNQDGSWKEESKIPEVHGLVTDVIETSDGTLWLETNLNHIWRISFKNKSQALKLENPIVETFGVQQGLPNDVGQLYNLDGNLFFKANIQNKTYRFYAETQSFQLYTEINKILDEPHKRIEFKEIDTQGNIWYNAYDSAERKSYGVGWKQNDGTYRSEYLAVDRAIDFIGRDIFPEMRDSVIWFGGDGITRFDLKIPPIREKKFYALIRKVNYQGDSLIFGGTKLRGSINEKEVVLPYQGNAFRFSYASPSFADENATQFQSILEGFDEDWSAWTHETQKDYTNLSEGEYTFIVRARNIYGQLSEEDQYAFAVLPPWYRSWWAYLLYFLAFTGFVGLIVYWRSAQLRREKEVLEATIKERTEEIRLKNGQLAEQTNQLKEMDQMKSRLFANISHEFRTPLTLIKGPVDQLLAEPEKQLSQENARMIRRNTGRLLRLVNQLLDLSKLDAGKLEVTPTQGDVNRWLRTMGSAFHSHAEQRSINYQTNISQDKLITSCDHDKLEQIVYNLLSNAFKFTPDGGQVILSCSYRKAELVIKVSDNGKGIPAALIPHIFDRFYQVDDSYTREQEGSGIGLALTKELVVLMGGSIKVESKPKIGTTFTVVLPLIQSELSDEKLLDTESQEFSPHIEEYTKEKDESWIEQQVGDETPIVLVVEDNADMRSFIKEQLLGNYQVIEAIHGKEGLKFAFEKIPDLIITDLMMPQMDGITLCNKLKNDERTSHIPIIMLTAKAGQEHKIEGLETGADDYLTKPFSVEELRVRVKNLIAQREQLRKRYSRELVLQPTQITIKNKEEEFLQHAMSVVEKNIGNDQFTVEEFQKEMGMSRMQLHRKLKALTDQSSSEFIRLIRMKRAAQLFAQKEVTVSEIAYEVGFTDPSYFAKCFKEVHGFTPKEYIQKAQIQ